jgi:antitoxin MazE
VSIPADQAWFWTERWQAMEREADEAIARGDVARFDSAEEFLEDLAKARGEE